MSDRIIDRSYHQETGELQQFTIIDQRGQPQLVKATAENILLYDPEDELPFEDGLYDFVQGEQALVLQQEDPVVMVAPTNNEYCYILRVRERTVETTKGQAERVLRGVKEAALDGSVQTLIDLHDEIVASQVRRSVINRLMQTFDEDDRLTKIDRGWLVDDFYLVNWEASMYTEHNDPDEGDYMRGGGGVEQTDTSYEFIQLSVVRDVEPIEVEIGGDTVRLTEREMLFLSKVKWLLNRRQLHSDMPFWKWTDQYANVDRWTGRPESSEEEDDETEPTDDPDPDTFNL